MRKQKGFTLIELMVTISIMVILTSAVLVNFGGTSVSRNLNIARNGLVSDLRRAQSDSLSARNYSATVAASEHGLVLNTASPTAYSIIVDDINIPANRSTSSTTILPASIYIKQISITRPDNSNTAATYLEILFKNPFARVLQTYTGGTYADTKYPDDITTITLGSYNDSSQTKTVTINGITGSIY